MADPTVAVPIPNQLVKKGQTVSLSLATNITDADAGSSDRLVWELGGFPVGTGLSIDSASGLITGTPNAADVAAVPFTGSAVGRRQSNGTITNSVILTFSGAVEAWYFGEGGNNSLDGRSYATRKATHAAVVSAGLQSGDVVFMCAAASGSGNRWTSTEQLLVQSGVTYHVYPGHYVLMEVNTPNVDEGAIHAVGKTGFTIEPRDGFLTLGDDSFWDPDFPTGDGQGDYTADRQLNFAGCTNFRLIGTGTGDWTTTNSNFVVHGGGRYVGNMFDQDCSHYLVRGIDGSKHGTNNDIEWAGGAGDWGDGFVFAGQEVYLDKCCFAVIGHAAYSSAQTLVVNQCDGNGDWTGYTDNADEGRGAPIERSGQRCFSVTGANHDNDDNGGGLPPNGPVLVQNCIFRSPGSAGDEHDNCHSEVYANHVIYRFNYLFDGVNDCVRASTFGDFEGQYFNSGTINYLKVYNNTMYGNGALWGFRNVTNISNCYKQCDFMNNIADEMRGTYFPGGPTSSDIQPMRWYPGSSVEGFANEWKGGRFAGNLIKNHSSAPEGTTIRAEVRNFSNSETVYTLAQLESTFSANWYNNQNASPTYSGNPAGGARTKATFAPNGGNETNNAEAHAIANGAGVSSTTLTVDSGQARLFFDGWGMTDFGLEADWIKIGSGAAVQISSIDYSANTITLTAARSWSDNDEVFLVLRNGSTFTTVSDIGAGQ